MGRAEGGELVSHRMSCLCGASGRRECLQEGKGREWRDGKLKSYFEQKKKKSKNTNMRFAKFCASKVKKEGSKVRLSTTCSDC